MPRNSSEHVRKNQETSEKAPLACSEHVKQGPEDPEATKACRDAETQGHRGARTLWKSRDISTCSHIFPP